LQYNMVKEIYEQPKVIADTLTEAFSQARKAVQQLNARNLAMIYFTGSGTSYHACLAANYALSTLTRIFSTSLPASEFSSWVGGSGRTGTVLIAISQSGESADVLAAAKSAADTGMHTIGVTNSAESSLAQATEFQLVSRAGIEKAVTATKSFTATLAATYALVIELTQSASTGPQSYEYLLAALKSISGKVELTIRLCDDPTRALASRFADKDFYFMLGSGPNYSTALEGALKLKESCNLYAEGFATREFLHGPMQLVDVRTPVFIIQGLEEEEQVHTLGERFLRFGASTVVIKRKSEDTVSRSTATIEVAPDIEEVFSPLAYVIPLQLYAYYSSLERGLNPDKPGKLTKVVK